MKKILFLSILSCLVAFAKAQTFSVTTDNGAELTFEVTDSNHVKVTNCSNTSPVIVPSSVTNEGLSYVVNEVGRSAFASKNALSYLELPETITILGSLAFSGSSIDTLVINSNESPLHSSGNEFEQQLLTALFGNALFKTVTVVVPAGRLAYYRTTAWQYLVHLTSPIAVPITMYAPNNVTLVAGFLTLKNASTAAGYYTMYYEIGDRPWLAPYINNNDSVFLGWDNGGICYTEITGADTLYPIYDRVGYGTLEVNNVSTPVMFFGQLGYTNNSANYFVPANSNQSPYYANGLWLYGVDTNNYFNVNVSRFGPGDFVPGPLTIDGSYSSDMETRRAFNRVWSVSRDEIDEFIANVGSDGYSIPEAILTWPGNGGEGYAPQMAPYYDADSDGLYNPHHGDYPLIRGDRMIFSIFNDVCVHPNTGSDPLGFEIHLSVYAFDEPNDTAMNNTVFVSYKIFNRSGKRYVDSWVGVFSDFDIGYGYDDFIGCDVRNGMAYGYNGRTIDNVYGETSPAQGCILLAGPYDDPDGRDNSRIDIEKMRQFYPDQLASYQLDDGSYDIERLNADADLYYPDAWHFIPDDITGNQAINGFNYGNGIVDDERIGMTRFLYYENSTSQFNGEPTNSLDYSYYLHGLWKNGTSMMYGGYGWDNEDSGIPCTFMFPHDSDPLNWGTNGIVPETDYYWNETNSGSAPGDRRGLQSSGPFTFSPDEVNTIDLAFTTSFGSSGPASSLSRLKDDALAVRQQFAHDTTS